MKTFCLILFCAVILPINARALSAEEKVISYARTGNEDALKAAVKKDKMLMLAADKYGNTLIITAAIYGQNALIKYLDSQWPNWNRPNTYGENALHAAVRFKHPGTAKLIVSLAAQDPDTTLEEFINLPDHTRRQTPLHWAAQSCDRDLYTFLVNWGADDKKPNAQGQTPATLLARCPAGKKTGKNSAKQADAPPIKKI